MRIVTGKRSLKKDLQVEVSQRNVLTPTVVVDVFALLWTSVWPVEATVETFITTFKCWFSKRLMEAYVYICLDRYHDSSIKSSTRSYRSTTARVYKLMLHAWAYGHAHHTVTHHAMQFWRITWIRFTSTNSLPANPDWWKIPRGHHRDQCPH